MSEMNAEQKEVVQNILRDEIIKQIVFSDRMKWFNWDANFGEKISNLSPQYSTDILYESVREIRKMYEGV